MTTELKKLIKKREKMNPISKVQTELFEESVAPVFSPKEFKLFSAVKAEEELCQTLDKSLFQLEKELAFFNFAVKEIKDITKTFKF